VAHIEESLACTEARQRALLRHRVANVGDHHGADRRTLRAPQLRAAGRAITRLEHRVAAEVREESRLLSDGRVHIEQHLSARVRAVGDPELPFSAREVDAPAIDEQVWECAAGLRGYHY